MKTKFKSLMYLTLLLACSNLWANNPEIGKTYFIESAVGFNNRFLQVEGGNPNKEAPININVFTNGREQKFKLRDAGDGWFHIESNTQQRRAIHVYGADKKQEAKVNLWDIVNQDNLKWKFIPAGDDYYYIQSKLGTFLDVQWGKSAKKTPVWMWVGNNGKAQKWKLHDINKPITFKREYKMKNFGGKCITSKEGHNPNGDWKIDQSTELNVDMTYRQVGNTIYATVILTIGTNGIRKEKNFVYARWTEEIFTATSGFQIRSYNPYYHNESKDLRMFRNWHNRREGMRLPQSGSEFIGCNDGKIHTFNKGDYKISVIGDTGGSDISNDYNCSCDTKLVDIEFNDFLIEMEYSK